MDFTEIIFLSLLVVSLVRVSSLWLLSIAYGFRKAANVQPNDRVSVIVPAFNEAKSISASIESLLAQNYGDFEVVVVDDGSTDSTLETARKFEGPRVKVLHQDNKGKAEALNTGIRAASGSVVLTVDADTRLGDGALESLARRFAAEKDLGALSGNVKVDRPRGLLGRMQDVEYATGIGLTRKGQSMLATVMIVPGPIAAFRKEAVEKVGYFSPSTYAEDFDITLAVLKARYRVEYEDRAVAYTIAPKNVEDLLKQRRRWFRGMVQVLAKNEDMFMRKKYGVAGMYGIPYMWYDTISPLVNLALSLMAVVAGFETGDWTTILIGLGFYWVLQTAVAISAILQDSGRRAWQILLSPLLIFYNTFLDGIRVAAFMEEVLSLNMKWETP